MTRRMNHILPSTLFSCLFISATVFGYPAASSVDEASHLDFLQWEVGRWSTDITMYIAPDQPPMQFKGRQIDYMSGCGQWLVTDLTMVAGDDGLPPPPYEGHGVLGWDPVKEKLVGIWVDSSKTWLATAEGTLDESGNVLTLRIQDRDPQSGEPMVTIFQTTRVDSDTRQLDVFIEVSSTERIPVARILSTRLPEGLTSRPSQSPDLPVWLIGSWIKAGDNVVMEEIWTEPRGDSMFGVNRTIRGGRTVAFEFLQIVVRDDGVYYLASPNGRYPPTPFKLTNHDNASVSFDNPDHDYPTRIRYQQNGDSLIASIHGQIDGTDKSSSWTYTKLKRKESAFP